MSARTDTASSPVRVELRALFVLAAPLVVVNLGGLLIGAVDMAVVGRLGAAELGGVGLGNTIFFAISTVGLGIMLGLDPLISQAVGAREDVTASSLLRHGLLLAIGVGAFLAGVVVLVVESLGHLGIDAQTEALTGDYLSARLVSMVPFLMMWAARSYLQSYSITRPMLSSVIWANIINLPTSWFLVFGDTGLNGLGLPSLGFDGLGVAGAGWATTLSIGIQLGILLLAVRKRHPAKEPTTRWDPVVFMRTFRLGLPVGLQLLAEVGVFTIVTVLMGNLGKLPLAAHNVAMTLTSVTFMVPLAISSAAAVRAGQGVGARDQGATRRAGWVSLASAASLSSLAALLFVVAGAPLAALLTSQSEVISAAAALLLIGALFQLPDNLQVVAAGVLRGMGDTRWPMVINIGCHYLVGLPIGIALAFGLDWGAAGLWWGLVAGLGFVSIPLVLRFVFLSQKLVARA
ncbi:MAG: MATE family efflux transporter [Deltaproteobacteria bacterium CG_4_9_14_3_um_filter_63_12]|nr:MAG: MATE family efflux transporter [Deltaproteobacteria bacterium CG_4_9_14_3_um_filter_63_12]